ncbi:MAG: alginate export family protein, partial [Gammaproteobacteria bacterium]
RERSEPEGRGYHRFVVSTMTYSCLPSMRVLLTIGRAQGFIAFSFAVSGTTALADFTILESKRFTLKGNFKLSLYGVTTDNTNFGAGVLNHAGEFHREADNFEYAIKPGFNFTWRPFNHGEFYGGFSAAATGQAGDGDPGGFTSGEDHALRPDAAFGGWRNGLIDVSFGRQEFIVGDQFLIGQNSNFNLDRDANLWVAPFKAFQKAGILRVEGDPVRGDLFWLVPDEDQGNAELAGVNLEYLLGKDHGKLGAMFGHILDVASNFDGFGGAFSPREGMEIYNLRANGVKLPGLPNLTLHAEAAIEQGSDSVAGGTRYDAYAWYAEGEYQFADAPSKPVIGYRYGEWSGDDDALTDAEHEAFDPLFYYQGRGWGTWYQGEIAGEYLLFNTNQISHMAKVVVRPTETIALWGLYFHHRLDEKNYFGRPVTNRHFLDEFNLVAEWFPDKHWYLVGVFAYGLPGAAAEQAFGNDEDYLLFEGAVIYAF